MNLPRIDKDILLQTLRGYAAVNRIVEAERRQRLQKMTDAEAREIFNQLNAEPVYLDSEEAARLAPLRLEHHLRVQTAMLKLWKSQQHEPTI